MTCLIPMLLMLGISPAQNSEKTSAVQPQRLTLENAESAIRAVAFSLDGNTVAAATEGTIVLWDRTSGKELCRADIDDNECRRCHSCVFSPDGQKLATIHDGLRTGPGRARILLWELTGRRQIRWAKTLRAGVISDAFAAVWQVAFSPDSKTLVTGDSNGTTYVWDVGTGKEILRFHGGVAATFAGDGKSMITVSHDGMIHRWVPGTNRRISADQAAVRTDFIHAAAVVFAPSRRLAAVGDGFTTWIKDLATGQTVRRLEFPYELVPLAFAANDPILAVAAKEGISLIDTKTGKEVAWRDSHPGCAFSNDGRYFARSVGQAVIVEEMPVTGTAGSQPPAAADPLTSPLRAELIVNQKNYTLDLLGLTPTEFSDEIRFDCLNAPRVNLTLKIRNTGDKPVTIRLDDVNEQPPKFTLVGRGAINVVDDYRQTGVGVNKVEPKLVTLAPGASHICSVVSLGHADDLSARQSYWVLPGGYTLYAQFMCSVLMPLKEANDKFENVWLRCPPVKLRVLPDRNRWAEPFEKTPKTPPLGALIVPKDEETKQLHWVLWMPVSLAGAFTMILGKEPKLQDVAKYISDLYGIDIRIDEEAFRQIGRGRAWEAKATECPLDGIRLDMVLHLLLEPLDAGYEIRKQTIWIVPLKQPMNFAERLGPANPRVRRWLYEPATLRPGIKKATLATALQVITERFGINFFIDQRAFARAGIKDVDRLAVKLGEKVDVPMITILKELLQQADATVVARDGVLLIIPRKKD